MRLALDKSIPVANPVLVTAPDAAAQSKLVYYHGWLHPERIQHVQDEFRTHGFHFSNDLSDSVEREADYIVTKARVIDDALLKRFRKLSAIVVQGRRPWMLETTDKLPVICLEEDRGYEVAEHAVALLLASIKKFPELSNWQYRFSLRSIYGWFLSRDASETNGAHNWTRIETDTLCDKRIGFVGYGAIGHQIHRRLSGFDASFAYYHHRPLPSAIESRLGLERCNLDQLFATCDLVFLQLPHNEQTEGVISETVLQKSKPNLRIINCGRAKVVDQTALYRALQSRQVAHYAADVFWREPMPLFSRFRLLRNCWITPHMAESLPNRRHRLNELTIQRIKAFETETFEKER